MHVEDGTQRWLGDHAVIDHRLMQTHEGVARHAGEVLNAQAADHVDHVVAAAAGIGQVLAALGGLLAHGGARGRTGLQRLGGRPGVRAGLGGESGDGSRGDNAAQSSALEKIAASQLGVGI